MRRLIFATNNKHKAEEVREALHGAVEIVTLSEAGLEGEIPETADTLQGNALQKAQWVYERTGQDCFADDTGLEVSALDGAPGVHTARYATLSARQAEPVSPAAAVGGEGFSPSLSHDSNANMNLLLHNLEKITDRSARFRTVIALIYQGQEYLFEGICPGSILRERHGTEGFGYDPVFQPTGYDRCFAEMSADEKNAISHRGRATQKLAEFLKDL